MENRSNRRVLQTLTTAETSFLVILLMVLGFSFHANGQPNPSRALAPAPPPDVIWSELLQRTPYPFTLPLLTETATPIDGTYVKVETKQEAAVPCRRCPDYAPEGGLWKLNLSKGVFRIFHPVTGWKGIGSFYFSGEDVLLANDPVCHELWGLYRWKLEEGNLTFTLIEDKCAIGLRAMNLTHLPWEACEPPKIEAATNGYRLKPSGCD